MGQQETVGTVQGVTQDPGAEAVRALAALRKRALADSSDREGWLRVRRGRVTATEAAKLAGGSATERRRILQEKLHPETVQSLEGNRYVDRGNAREGIIASWIADRFPGMEHNTVLYGGLENPLHAATPDMAGVCQARFTLGEIKTSKHDLTPDEPGGYFWRSGYFDQCQWQMYVAGAQRLLFVWEQHDDQWPDPQPLELEPQYRWIQYRPDRVAKMIAQADLLLAELHQEQAKARTAAEGTKGFAVAEGVPIAGSATITGDVKQQAEVLGLAVLSGRAEESTAKARKDAAWKSLQTLLADQPSFSHEGLSRVTWSAELTTTRVPDQEAALAAPVEGLEGVTGADLHADLARAREVWDAHQAKHWKDQQTQKPSLTVTDPAAKRSTKGGKR